MTHSMGYTPLSRRGFLRGSAATAGLVAMTLAGGLLSAPNGAWAFAPKTLKPETARVLVQMARDTYPHDRFSDAIYAQAVAGYDDKAATDAAFQALLEDGVADLNSRAKDGFGAGSYDRVGWEENRLSILRAIAEGPFFQAVRSDLVVSIYNNHAVWEILGYEGSSADKGGYIDRGFNDLDWV
ncbi:MAG: twin-arginine translocation signal domain-containing protein [Rhodospirillum sp.]|nr:twin-arginine translocation signal domain-containing protein [Rhodospirillum sp.]MCF8489889.1 twin-arginine translocation signal domain-containing protein [Rhodospirillum sp.]